MYNVDTFRKAVFAQANKDNIGFKPSADEFNSFMADGLREIRNYLYGSDSDYAQGRPVAITAGQKNRLLAEANRYWMERRTLSVNVLPGEISIPIPDGVVVDNEDEVCPRYSHLEKLLTLYIPEGFNQFEKREIRVLPSSEVQRALDSEINYPTAKNPIAELDKDRYLIYPTQGITYVQMVYYRIPESPVWAFTVDDTLPIRQRREIYDPANSVDIDAPDEVINMMKERVLGMMAVRERDQFMVQSSAARDQGGFR